MNHKLVKSEVIFNGKVFDLKVDQIEYNNSGNLGIREVAVHAGGAVVVPITAEGKVVMITQYRYPFDKVLLELPAGKLDTNEDPELCAARELEEETGFTAKEIIKLSAICTTPGFCTEILHIYLAQDLTEGHHNREEGEEGMEVFEFTFNEVEDKIVNGEIIDAKTICGIFLAKKYINKNA